MDIIAIIQIVGGLILLIAGGEGIVRGGVAIAHKFRLSPMVVGMTVVAFGTSAPELIVSLYAAVNGHPEISMGNVIGSNIANIALVLGASALILPLPVKSKTLGRDWLFLVAVSIIYLITSLNGIINFAEGIFFIALLIAFLFLTVKNNTQEEKVIPKISIWVANVVVLAASVALAYGADLLVKGASQIAREFGLSEKVIGVTIVAFGTSLPELTASIIAALRKQTDISIGNVIGSNIFNILAVIGLSSVVHQITFIYTTFDYDFIWMLALPVFLLIIIIPPKNYAKLASPKAVFANARLGRFGAALLFISYVLYVYFLF